MVDDRDQAWRDFNGWRVNYDAPLRGLERLTMAPAPWWDRPMRSAYETDEPIGDEPAVPATPGGGCSGSGDPGSVSYAAGGEEHEVRRDHEGRHDDQRGHDTKDADAPHPPGDRAERAAVVVVVVTAGVAIVVGACRRGGVIGERGGVMGECGVVIAHGCLVRTSGGHCPTARTP